MGAGQHFEYRIIGDVVNTSTRIEGLNKQIGTQILASAEMLENLDDIYSREVGHFRLKGKEKALTLFELTNQPIHQQQLELFIDGLRQFQNQRWSSAINSLNQLLKHNPEDGPSLFYKRLAGLYQQSPPGKNWDGVVNISQK